MKSRTLYFAPGRASPGMTLAKAATDSDGHTLLAEGTTLDAEMLERLIRRRIETICILAPDHRDDETIDREMQAARRRVDAIFRGHGSAARSALHAALLDYRKSCTQ